MKHVYNVKKIKRYCTWYRNDTHYTETQGMTLLFCVTPRYYLVRTGWFRLNAKNCVPGNSSRRFFELDHEILHTYSGRQYLKLEEGVFLIWGFAVEISGF